MVVYQAAYDAVYHAMRLLGMDHFEAHKTADAAAYAAYMKALAMADAMRN